MKKLRVYVAGKVNPNSVFGTSNWREGFCAELSKISGFEIINLDPTKNAYYPNINENDPDLVFGRDSFLISKSDIVIVQLTDDISVGGSQEMLIAKYFSKPLIGIAKRNGKFVKDVKIIQEKKYQDYIAAFVAVPCDAIVENIEQAAQAIQKIVSNPQQKIPNLQTLLDDTIKHYSKLCPLEHYALNEK